MGDLAQQLQGKLRQLNSTQQSIESTANWCLFYSREAPTIVRVWDEEFVRTPVDRKVTFLYLANHLLQEGRKKGREFGEEFAKVMSKALKETMRLGDDRARKTVARLVGIWEERKVFTSGHVKVLKDTVAKGQAMQVVKEAKGGSSGGSAAQGADSAKLQAVGNLADVLHDVAAAAAKSGQHTSKAMQLKPNLHIEGTANEVAVGRETVTACVVALQAEIRQRQRAISELRAAANKQEEAVQRAQGQLQLFQDKQDALKNRMVVLETVAAHLNPGQKQHAPQVGMGAPAPQQQHQQQPPLAPQAPMLPLGAIGSNGMGALPPGFPMLPPGMQLPPGMLPPEQLLTLLATVPPDQMAAIMQSGMPPMPLPGGLPMQQGGPMQGIHSGGLPGPPHIGLNQGDGHHGAPQQSQQSGEAPLGSEPLLAGGSPIQGLTQGGQAPSSRLDSMDVGASGGGDDLMADPDFEKFILAADRPGDAAGSQDLGVTLTAGVAEGAAGDDYDPDNPF